MLRALQRQINGKSQLGVAFWAYPQATAAPCCGGEAAGRRPTTCGVVPSLKRLSSVEGVKWQGSGIADAAKRRLPATSIRNYGENMIRRDGVPNHAEKRRLDQFAEVQTRGHFK